MKFCDSCGRYAPVANWYMDRTLCPKHLKESEAARPKLQQEAVRTQNRQRGLRV